MNERTAILICVEDPEEADHYDIFLSPRYVSVAICKSENILASLASVMPTLLIIELKWLPTNPRDAHPLKSLVYPNATPEMPALMAIADRQINPGQFDPMDSHYAPFDMCVTRPIEPAMFLRLVQRMLPETSA